MLFEIVIVICAAFASAGVVLLAFKLVRRKAPKVLMLGAAALGMVGYTQWDRYTWADRYAASLPPESVVVDRYAYDGWLEPWARVMPRADRLLVLDGTATLRNPDFPHMSVVTTLLVERNQDTLSLRQFIDCSQRRRAPVTGQTGFTEAGLPLPDAWIAGGQPQPLFDAVCAGQ